MKPCMLPQVHEWQRNVHLHTSYSGIHGDLPKPQFNLIFTGCFLNELWNLPAPDAIFLNDVSLLENAAQYPSCDDGSVGSVVLVNTTLNTSTVVYYTGTTAGSRACFVCNNGSEYAPNTTISNERVCQNDGRWSKTPVVCGMLQSFGTYYIQNLEPCRAYIDTCMCEPQGSVRF